MIITGSLFFVLAIYIYFSSSKPILSCRQSDMSSDTTDSQKRDGLPTTVDSDIGGQVRTEALEQISLVALTSSLFAYDGDISGEVHTVK